MLEKTPPPHEQSQGKAPETSDTGQVDKGTSDTRDAVSNLEIKREVNPSWNEAEESSFTVWDEKDDWQHIGVTEMEKGSDFTVDGKRFHTTETPGSHQLLRVQWPNKTGRAHFGYVVRANDGEVVAAIHQGGGWSWWFKLKYEPEEFKKNHHEEGWVRENLMANCLNSVMSWLEKS